MQMQILGQPIDRQQLKDMAAKGFGDMVKAVVDVERNVLAVDAELHADLESLLLEDGSQQNHLWGINLYPAVAGDDFLEFDSMINIRPSQGNRSRGVDDIQTQQAVRAVVAQWVPQ